MIERSTSRELSLEKHETIVSRIDVPPERTNTFNFKRRSLHRMESFSEEENKTNNDSPKKTTPASTVSSWPFNITLKAVAVGDKLLFLFQEKKPLILRVPHPGNFSSLSDIMRRLKRGTPGILRKGVNSTMSDRTQSMMDLSENNHDDRQVPVPRFMASVSVHDEVSHSIYRNSYCSRLENRIE